MRRLLSTPPSIRIAAESVDDARDAAVDVPTGLELVPAWQARPARRRRRLWATMAVAAVVAAAALVASGDHGARGQTARPTPAHERDLGDTRPRRLPRVVRPAHRTRRLGRAPGRLAIIALLVLAAVGV